MPDTPAQTLGAFLRLHRERLTPDGPVRRRRTPGLRREEVAQLAGISVTWLTRLEQGRDVQASAPALARLASALRLSRAERAYLFELAGRHDPTPGTPAADEVSPTLLKAVEATKAPAYVLDAAWTACAWNRPALELFPGWLGGAEKNLLRYVFLDPGARRFIVGWDERAARLVAEFRIDHEKRRKLPAVSALAEVLIADCPAFRFAWEQQNVLEREGGMRAFEHPVRGRLIFDQITLTPASEPDFKLVLLLPR